MHCTAILLLLSAFIKRTFADATNALFEEDQATTIVTFGRVLFWICKQTDRHTDVHTRSSQYFAPLPTWGEVKTSAQQ